MNLGNFKKHTDWVKVWSGKWSLHSDSHFGGHWTVRNKVGAQSAFERVIYFYKNGISDCWVTEKEKADLGRRLTELLRGSNDYAEVLANSLKNEAQKICAFMRQNKSSEIGIKKYTEFWDAVSDYYLPHLSVKYSVDYLSKDELDRLLPILEDARLYAEPVFRDIEDFFESIANRIADKTSYRKEEILCTLDAELRTFFDTGGLPPKETLDLRWQSSALVFERGKWAIYAGREVQKIEELTHPKVGLTEIKGQTAYKGMARGRVRIVWDPSIAASSFEVGDILVTGMTRPEFLPLMEKAAAFVTDAGGILSHAAIIAREMRKPCIIGTGIATKVLKTGDTVEVNANSGVVAIIK